MIEFFEMNGISPNEVMDPKIKTLESLIKKRINGVIAILKDNEKSQTKPTVAMMQSLFEHAEKKTNPLSWKITISGQKYQGPPETYNKDRT